MHYGLIIKVMFGFYAGCTGLVTDIFPTGHVGVNLVCKDKRGTMHRFYKLVEKDFVQKANFRK